MESKNPKASLKASSASLRKLGAFTPRLGVKKEIPCTDPETGEPAVIDVYIRKQSLGTFLALKEEGEKSKTPGAILISQSVFEDEQCKKPVLTEVEALDLEPEFAATLFNLIHEVNEGPKKFSPPRKDSSAS